MPINRIIVRGKHAIRDLLTWEPCPIKNLILIRNPDVTFEDASQVPRLLGVKFWDTAPEWKEYLLGHHGENADYPLPPVEDLEKIFDFIQDLEDIEENETLHISCHMGVSRSGAVGAFANKYFGLDWSDFKRDNPQVQPNPFIERELNRLLEERNESNKY